MAFDYDQGDSGSIMTSNNMPMIEADVRVTITNLPGFPAQPNGNSLRPALSCPERHNPAYPSKKQSETSASLKKLFQIFFTDALLKYSPSPPLMMNMVIST